MLWVDEEYSNADEGYNFGSSGPYETFTDKRGKLFRSMQQEYGRCVSKVYRNTAQGPKPVGWVFQGRQRYDDARTSWPVEKQTYIREVWVTVYENVCPDHGMTWDSTCFRCTVMQRC